MPTDSLGLKAKNIDSFSPALEQADRTASEPQRTRLTQIISIFLIGLSLLYGLETLIFAPKIFLFFDIYFIAFYTLCLVLARLRRANLAKIVLVIIGNLHALSFVISLGAGFASATYLIAVTVFSFFLFHPSQKAAIACSVSFSVVSYFGCSIYLAFWEPIGDYTNETHELLNWFMTSLFAWAIMLVVIVSFNRQTILFRRSLAVERDRSEHLLLNILPPAIAKRLKGGETTIADTVDDASVLFADLVHFTQLSQSMSATELVELLNRVFSQFDSLCRGAGAEKIKTIGDAYMAVGGIGGRMPNHPQAMAELGESLVVALAAMPEAEQYGLSIRVGVHTGPLVAGVIGTDKFAYDLWGETVNFASRLESHGVAGRVHISAATARRLRPPLGSETRGSIAVKGVGAVETYLLTRLETPQS